MQILESNLRNLQHWWCPMFSRCLIWTAILGFLLVAVLSVSSCTSTEGRGQSSTPARAEIVQTAAETWEIRLSNSDTVQPELVTIGPAVWQINLRSVEQIGKKTEFDPQNFPGCDKPKEWQWILQYEAAKDDDYLSLSNAMATLCLYCPDLAQQLGVSCTGVCVDSPPPDAGEAGSDGASCVPPFGGAVSGSMKGYDCIVGCKRVYEQCMKACVESTVMPPQFNESVGSCSLQCIEKERQCLDVCLK